VAPIPRLFINYIPIDKNREDIHQLLEAFGDFLLLQILPNYNPQQPEIKLHQKAWVELPNFTKAEFLLNKLHGSFPWGKSQESQTQQYPIFPLEITFANPRLATPYHAAEQAISPKKLFIGGIAPAATEQDVRSLLTPFGEIESLTLLVRGGRCNRNCAFVQFSTWAACEAAIQALHSKFTMAGTDAPLLVKFADAQRIDPTHKMKIHRSKQRVITPLAANVHGGGAMGGISSYMHPYPTPHQYGMTMMMSPPNAGGYMDGYTAYNGYHAQQMVMPSSAYPNHQQQHQVYPHVHLGGDGGGYPSNNNGNGGGVNGYGGYFSHNNNDYCGHQRRGSGGETQFYNSNGFRGRYPREQLGSSNNGSTQYNYNPGKINVGSRSIRSRSSGGSGSIEATLKASNENLTTDEDATVLPGEIGSKTETASISCSDDKSPKSDGTGTGTITGPGTVVEEVVVYFNGGGGGKSDINDDGKDEGFPPESLRQSDSLDGCDGGKEKTKEAGQKDAKKEEEKEAVDDNREGSEMHEYEDCVGNRSHATSSAPSSAAALVAAAAAVLNGNGPASQEHVKNNNINNRYNSSNIRYNSNGRGRGRKISFNHHNNRRRHHHNNQQYDHHHQQAAYYNNPYHDNAQYYCGPDVVGNYYQQTVAPPPSPARMYYGSDGNSGTAIPTMPITNAVPNTGIVPIDNNTLPLMPYLPIPAANGGVGWMASPLVLHPLGTDMGHPPLSVDHLYSFSSPPKKGNGKIGKGVKDFALYAHKLFIGQLSSDTIEEELYEWFACFGEILELAVLRLDGKSQGCAFLTYSRKEHALAAKDAMNGKPVGKLRKRIVVKFADVGKTMGGEEEKDVAN
jgi:RNA recognition motif-containing protein